MTLEEIEKKHCTCDLLNGYTCSIHKDIAELKKVVFIFERLPTQGAVRRAIADVEGKHVQQAIFSTFMDCLTQIDFTAQRIRSTIEWEGNRSWNPNKGDIP